VQPTAGRDVLSIVVPAYNEEESLPALFEALSFISEELGKIAVRCEMIIVDNASTDHTWEVLTAWASEQPPGAAVVIRHPVNLGMQKSLLTGLRNSSGSGVLVLQSDLQDPPEVALALAEAWAEGNTFVVGRIRRRDLPLRERVGTWLFYVLLRFLSGKHVISNASDFYVVDSSLIPEVLVRGGNIPFLRTTLQSIRQPDVVISYERRTRIAGRPGSLRWRLRFGVDALVQDLSALCSRLALAAILLTSLSVVGLVGIVVAFLLGYRSPVAGWLTFTLLLLLLLAFTSAFAAVVLLLLNRIYRDLPRQDWAAESLVVRS
jgi:glycosyltransferase involved in cell wall biosynthesis